MNDLEKVSMERRGVRILDHPRIQGSLKDGYAALLEAWRADPDEALGTYELYMPIAALALGEQQEDWDKYIKSGLGYASGDRSDLEFFGALAVVYAAVFGTLHVLGRLQETAVVRKLAESVPLLGVE